jgi:hypothetical protein
MRFKELEINQEFMVPNELGLYKKIKLEDGYNCMEITDPSTIRYMRFNDNEEIKLRE